MHSRLVPPLHQECAELIFPSQDLLTYIFVTVPFCYHQPLSQTPETVKWLILSRVKAFGAHIYINNQVYDSYIGKIELLAFNLDFFFGGGICNLSYLLLEQEQILSLVSLGLFSLPLTYLCLVCMCMLFSLMSQMQVHPFG